MPPYHGIPTGYETFSLNNLCKQFIFLQIRLLLRKIRVLRHWIQWFFTILYFHSFKLYLSTSDRKITVITSLRLFCLFVVFSPKSRHRKKLTRVDALLIVGKESQWLPPLESGRQTEANSQFKETQFPKLILLTWCFLLFKSLKELQFYDSFPLFFLAMDHLDSLTLSCQAIT